MIQILFTSFSCMYHFLYLLHIRTATYRIDQNEMDGVFPFLSNDFLNYAIIVASIFHPTIHQQENANNSNDNQDDMILSMEREKELLLKCCVFLVDENRNFLL